MSLALLLLSVATVFAAFGPNIRIDHENNPDRGSCFPAITLGPGKGATQPIYVAFEDDSVLGTAGADIMFQKSIDAGRTWLPADVLVRRGKTWAMNPDVVTDPDGNVYIVYTESPSHDIYCVKSTDSGATWSTPARVDDKASGNAGWARVAVDTAGNLFCAWHDWRTGSAHIWSSASSDRGMIWSRNVRVDDDMTNEDCCHTDVCVQPGTNRYLVVASAPYDDGSRIHYGCYLYSSTDAGHAFHPGIRLDTFGGYTGQPHVVADARQIICDYTGESKNSELLTTEARTLYTQPDTWGNCSLVSKLDPAQYWSYLNGAKLAISADGYVHSALMICCDTSEGIYLAYYARSSDHGVTWSEPQLVNDDTTRGIDCPDIGADSAGDACIVWMTKYIANGEIWFATNNSAAIAEQPQQPSAVARAQIVSRYDDVQVEYELPTSAHVRATLHDAVGRLVGAFDAGEQQAGVHRLSWKGDGTGLKLSPGAYFVLLNMGKEQARLKAVVR